MNQNYLLYRTAYLISNILPRKIMYWLAKQAGFLYYSLSKQDKKNVLKNVSIIFPNKTVLERNKIAKQTFVNFAKYLVDFFRFKKINKNFILKNVKVIGEENLQKALSEKKGVIAIAAHIGNWELGGVTLPFLGYNVAAIALEHKNKKINDFFVKQRKDKGVEVIGIGMSLRRCFHALKANKILAILGDIDFTGNGKKVLFFGKEAVLPKGPILLARKTGAPIVPSFLVRNNNDTFSLMFDEPITGIRTENDSEFEDCMFKKIIPSLEKYIHNFPGQWSVFKNFWRI